VRRPPSRGYRSAWASLAQRLAAERLVIPGVRPGEPIFAAQRSDLP
jgi:hypothetical protein